MFHSAELAPFGYNICCIFSHYNLEIAAVNSIRLVSNICGYIPIVGSISGLVKVIFSIILSYKYSAPPPQADPSAEPDYYYIVTMSGYTTENAGRFIRVTFLRSIVELTSCGALLLIPDMIVTIGRACTKAPKVDWYEGL